MERPLVENFITKEACKLRGTRQSIRVRETNPIFFETAASSSYFLEVKKNSNNIEQRGVRGMVSRIDFSREIFTCYSL